MDWADPTSKLSPLTKARRDFLYKEKSNQRQSHVQSGDGGNVWFFIFCSFFFCIFVQCVNRKGLEMRRKSGGSGGSGGERRVGRLKE